MDKPKGQISIKLNGEQKNFVEGSKKKIYPETSIDPYSSEDLIESNEIEEDTILETAAAQEAMDESFDWIIPEPMDNDIEEYKIVNTSTKQSKKLPNFKKKNGGSYSSILIPGIFAILIGTTFGFLMLKLVLTDHSNKAITEPAAPVTQQGASEESLNTATATIKSFAPYVIQEGVYTTKQSADVAVKKVEAIGLPAKAFEMNGKEYLFLGVADSQDMAKQMGGLYTQKGINGYYAKPLTVDGKTLSKVSENEKTFLEALPSIYQSLSSMTSSAITSKKISKDNTKEIDVLVSDTGIKNETVKNLRDELAAAEEKLKAYQKTKQTKNLTEAQQHLLTFLAQYYALK